jgi:outer membrane protein with beta-barrel domain|tara:strand:- start:122 stop:766 length:645 start_codon:yes stop_codon:yes gene_type:complete
MPFINIERTFSMFKKTLLVSGIALAVSAPAMAEQQTSMVRDNGFSYTYGQLAYDRWDLDNDVDVDALTAEGSFALDEHIFLRGSLGFFDGDYDRGPFRDGDVDGTRLSAGAGFHTPLQRGLDFVTSADIIYDDRDLDPGKSDDEIGFELRGGLRHATTEQLELSGGLTYMDLYDDDLGVYGQGLFKLTPVVDLGARVIVGGDRDTYGVFGRYNF